MSVLQSQGGFLAFATPADLLAASMNLTHLGRNRTRVVKVGMIVFCSESAETVN